MASSEESVERILAEQNAYYDAIAPEYDSHGLEAPGKDEVLAALDAFRPTGEVLELACGPGQWTPRLLAHASSVTALDASPQMLAIAASRLNDDRLRFVHADVFAWEPDRRYDAIFFGFLLSHVPLERFQSFWELIERVLTAAGKVFFVDDGYRAPDEFIDGESIIVRRRLNDGSTYRIIKIEHQPAELKSDLARIGWDVAVHRTTGPFYWGVGGRASS